MSRDEQRCALCGTPKSGWLGDNCPTCLMRLGAPGVGQPKSDEAEASTKAGEAEPPTKLSEAIEQGPGTMIGRYKLLEKVGEGGFGTVYVAEQREPVKRRVALKIIKLGMDTKQVIARFEAERQALALMDHPNIAKVLEAAATDTGRPFFVMELVRGIKITDYCDQNNLSTPQRLDLFINVCQAIQHAHQKGIIHRDIKPSNILVTLHDGVPVPKVIDFGIAKATQGELTDKTVYTQLQEFIGTPAYMSPEQAEMSGLDIDTRADIYSLGVLLYELLTGKTPFDAKDLLAAGLQEMRRTIREKEPMRPSTRLTQELTSKSKIRDPKSQMDEVSSRRLLQVKKLIELLRGDLDWIVMKCLEKDRTRRYGTANGLASDVQRYLDTEPVTARPPSQLYRIQKMVRRNKLAFGATSAVAAALIIGLGLSTWLFVRERGTRQRAETAEREQARQRQQAEAAQANELRLRQNAEAQAVAARKKAYAADMILLQQALARDDLGRAKQLLDRQRPGPGQQDFRGWEWRYYWQLCQSDAAFTLCQRSNWITSVSFSSQGTLLAVATFSGEVTVWELPSRRMVFQRPDPSKPVFSDDDDGRSSQTFGRGKVVFAPDGDLLAYYDGSNPQKAIVLWNARQRAETRRLLLGDPPRDFAFTRDGRLFTAGSTGSNHLTVLYGPNSPNNITVWDVASGAVLNAFSVPTPAYRLGTVFNITRDGDKFAYVPEAGSGTVRVQNVMPRTQSVFTVPGRATTALEFTLDGQLLATSDGYASGVIGLWDTGNRQVGSLEGHRGWISCLKALPDGKTLASASGDGTIRLWDVATRQPIKTLRGQNGELLSLDVSSDGRWLASGSKDGSVSLWDLSSSTNRRPPYQAIQTRFQTNGVWWWSYSPDGRLVAALGRNGRLFLGQTATPEQMIRPDLPSAYITGFAFSPDSRSLAASDDSGHVSLWDIPGQHLITNFAAHAFSAFLFGAGFMAGGHSLLTYDQDGEAKEWDATTWQEVHRVQLGLADPQKTSFSPNILKIAICPEARMVAVAYMDEIEVLSIDSPDKRRRFTGQHRVNEIKFSRDGTILASASDSGVVELWDTAKGTRTAALHGILLGYHSVAFSPDGERLAASTDGREAIEIWDLSSLEEVAILPGEGSLFVAAQFSLDGDTISARNWGDVVHFWRAPGWAEINAAERALQTTTPR